MAETKVSAALDAAADYLRGARAVLRLAIDDAENLGCDACDAAGLLVEQAQQRIDSGCEEELLSRDGNIAHIMEGALEILGHGARNEHGNESPDSGLGLGAVWIVHAMLERADDAIELARRPQ